MAVSLIVTTRHSKSAVSLYLRILLIFAVFFWGNCNIAAPWGLYSLHLARPAFSLTVTSRRRKNAVSLYLSNLLIFAIFFWENCEIAAPWGLYSLHLSQPAK